MKILFVRNGSLGRPGAAATYYLPILLARLGHDVILVARSGGTSSEMEDAGIKVIQVENGSNWLFSLRHIAAEERPDIIHVFIHAGCGIYPFIMRSESRPKFVLDIRSPLLRGGLMRKIVQFKNQFEIYGYDAVTAHSIESAHTVIGHRHEIFWVPPGVDFSLLSMGDPHRKRSNEEVKLVYIGSLDHKRGILDLISAVLITGEYFPLVLDIYGAGDTESDIRELICNRKSMADIRLLGQLPRQELLKRLPSYDIGLAYVPHALFDAAPPLKTLEFLACGLPVVATNTFGNRMFVESGVNGLLVDDDSVSYAQGIVDIVNAEWLGAARTNSRHSVESFDWRNIVLKRLLPLYQGLLNKNEGHNET